jgi:hypothetical protein
LKVTFKNTAERLELGGFDENEHNTTVLTPAKNAHNLKEFELHLIDRINQEGQLPIIRSVQILREFHRPLISIYKSALNEVKLRNEIDIVFPEKDDGSEIVEIVSTSEKRAQNGENELIVIQNSKC